MTKARSIKGEVVDFDLMKIKRNMENRNKPDSVELREKYIDIRRRRNPRRNVADLENEQRANEADARGKIRQSRETKAKVAAEAEAEASATPSVEIAPVVREEPAEESVTVADVVAVPAEMSDPVETTKKPKTSRRIVKNSKSED